MVRDQAKLMCYWTYQPDIGKIYLYVKDPFESKYQLLIKGKEKVGNVIKYEFLTGKDVLPEKDLPKEGAALKTFEYLPLGKELKAQTKIVKKQYKKLEATDEFVSIKKEIPTIKKYKRSNLLYDSRNSFYENYNYLIVVKVLLNQIMRFNSRSIVI